MKLYHFTSRGHMKRIITEGVSKCRIPWMIDPHTHRVGFVGHDDPYQWLTESEDWAQDWDAGECPPMPPYLRTECRLAIDFSGFELTKLFRWSDFCRVNRPQSAEFLNSFPSSRFWYLYHGVIHPRQFIANDRNPNPCVRTPAFE